MRTTRRSGAGRAALAACLALLLALAAALPGPALAQEATAPRIGVMTMQPGTVFWERFGHDAIVVVDPRSGQATSYNFGFFDPEEPGFLGRFVRGIMQYRLVALPLEQDLATYRDEGRGVSIQWLDLAPAQARALAADLAVEARPENARYRYDYYTANCATRVRDAVDRATGGALRAALAAMPSGQTYRSESLRLARPAPWMWLGFDIGLSGYADVPLALWDDAFLPTRLAAGLDEVRLADGRSLVSGTQELLPHRIAPEPASLPRRPWAWAAAGLALAGLLAWLGGRQRRALAGFALAFWGVSGLVGALLLFLWLGTGHRAAWANANLLLFDPLALLALPGALALVRGRASSRPFRAVLALLAAAAGIAALVHAADPGLQANLRWILLLLPVHLALWWRLGREAGRAPSR